MVTDAPQLGALLDGPNPFIAVSVLGKTLLGHAEASLEELTGQRRKQSCFQVLRTRAHLDQQVTRTALRANSSPSVHRLEPVGFCIYCKALRI
jgi:hypothetical protein